MKIELSNAEHIITEAIKQRKKLLAPLVEEYNRLIEADVVLEELEKKAKPSRNRRLNSKRRRKERSKQTAKQPATMSDATATNPPSKAKHN